MHLSVRHQRAAASSSSVAYTLTGVLGAHSLDQRATPRQARFSFVREPFSHRGPPKSLLGGIAAAPHPGGTSIAFVGGLRLPGMRLFQPLIDTVGEALAAGALRRLADRIRLRDAG